MKEHDIEKSPFGKKGMFNEASHLIFEKAKELRSNLTAAETVVWMHVRGGVEGCKFRRQHPIGIYVADFYCHKAKLIVEIDGSIHSLPEIITKDNERTRDLTNWGYKLIRFSNEEVMKDVELVIKKIGAEVVNQLSRIKNE
jgi:cyclase